MESPEPKKSASSVHDIHTDHPPFGSRYLTPDKDVWSKNAWDHVPPPADQGERIAASLARQRAKPVPDADKNQYNTKPAKHWDNFYKNNADNFFRDRKWLHTEFPDLVAATRPEAGPCTIAELGCGAGNSVFPLLSSNQNPDLQLFAFDYSNHAVKLVQRNPLYDSPPLGRIHADVWDLSSQDGPPACVSPGSVDIVVLIFVLSALHPTEWAQAIANIYQMLKPGGLVVLRDYGRYDLTQLRFKEGRLLSDNLYIRGDKTRVYFFELDDLALLFTGSPVPARNNTSTTEHVEVCDNDDEKDFLNEVEKLTLRTEIQHDDSAPDVETSTPPPSTPPAHTPSSTSPPSPTPLPLDPSSAPNPQSNSIPSSDPLSILPPHPLFATTALGIDRRLLVNRKRQLKMHRVWVQGAFRKLTSSDPPTCSNSEET